MRAPRGARPLAWIALSASALLLVGIGCSTVLGLGDYAIDHDGGSAPGDSGPEEDTSTEAGCDVDLKVQCYPCAAETNAQILNTCVEGNCVQFDESRTKPFLLPDGGWPPLPATPPVPDASSDAADAADGGG